VDAVDLLMASRWVTSRREAVAICQAMMREYNLFHHVWDTFDFKDDYYFYRFTDKSARTGGLELQEVLVPAAQDVQQEQQPQQQPVVTLEQIAEDLQANVTIENRRYHLRVYNTCFVGSQAVSFLVGANYAPSRSAAVELGRRLATELNLFDHVTKEHELEDDFLFYRFVEKDERVIPPKQKEETGDNDGSLSSYVELNRMGAIFRTNVTVTTHRYRLQNYRGTFIGSEAVDFLVNSSMAKCRKDAVALGRRFCKELQLFHHIKREHDFKDDFLFYRYNDDDSMDKSGSSVFSDSVASDHLSTEKLESVAQAMRRDLPLKNRRRLQRSYKNTFLGTEVVDYLVRTSVATSRKEAVQLGRELARVCNLFEHVEGYYELQDMRLFYQFKTPLIETVGEPSADLTELRDLACQFVAGIAVKNNRYHLRVYRNTFVGEDAVSFLVDAGLVTSREDAVQLGRKFMSAFNLFEHVTRDHSFDDKFYFYRYTPGSERLLLNVPSSRASSELDEEGDDEEEVNSVVGVRDEGSSMILRRKISEFGEKATTRRQQARGSLLSANGVMLEITTAARLRRWASDFRRRDPRYRILNFFTEVAQSGAQDIENTGIHLQNIHPLLWFISRAAVFTVWRPCHYDAIRKMMLGQAVGKGFDIKGKSAKKGKLSGFVPFLQISENRHKEEVRTLPKKGRIRLFLSSQNFHARIEVANRLEAVAEEMMSTVAEAKDILCDRNTDAASREQAEKILLWDVEDFSITFIDDYAPACYGLDIPLRVFWELFITRRDISRKPDSQYYDPQRPSTPDYQDYNLHSLVTKPIHGNPCCVLYQNDRFDPMNPHELLMAYQDPQRVLPVVSDFDAFLVGTRRVSFDPVKGALSPDQLEVLQWSTRQIGKILDGPIRPENWNKRWLEVLSREKRRGFHPSIPRFGFGDPRSYSIMENAVHRLSDDGAVRHGPECFNYTFPQEADEEFLVISDILTPVPWKYMNPEELQDFLSARIDDGYTFPLNPKWVLCDPGWKPLYDRLLASQREDVQNSMKIWFPPESGVREQIEEIHARNPNGFERGVRGSEK
jgi:Domain found in Dishevelled, Egl-10, and Pleckstrin (DEP)